MNERRLLTVPEASERLGVSRTKGWQLAHTQQIPVLRIGRSVRVPAEALEAWIQARTSRPDDGTP
jgi:excisionase family DNA binding protein